MTTLATQPLEPNLLDELALIADPHTPTRKPFADKFRAACEAEARIDGLFDFDGAGPAGWINPNRVRARLLDDPDYRPRQYSSLWSKPFLAKADRLVQIAGEGSRGNTNKSVFWREWIGEPETCKACHGKGQRLHGLAICPKACEDCGGTGEVRS